ncbi:sel1 repeat family protein [Pelomyxa schiedti]|nr:sel1 repeat family protein [Pelomyxa schiedti]
MSGGSSTTPQGRRSSAPPTSTATTSAGSSSSNGNEGSNSTSTSSSVGGGPRHPARVPRSQQRQRDKDADDEAADREPPRPQQQRGAPRHQQTQQQQQQARREEHEDDYEEASGGEGEGATEVRGRQQQRVRITEIVASSSSSSSSSSTSSSSSAPSAPSGSGAQRTATTTTSPLDLGGVGMGLGKGLGHGHGIGGLGSGGLGFGGSGRGVVDMMCGVCFGVVRSPVSLQCGHLVCYSCLCGLASYSVLHPAARRGGGGGPYGSVTGALPSSSSSSPAQRTPTRSAAEASPMKPSLIPGRNLPSSIGISPIKGPLGTATMQQPSTPLASTINTAATAADLAIPPVESRVDSGVVQVPCPHRWCQKLTEVRLVSDGRELFADPRLFPVQENIQRSTEAYSQRLVCEAGRCQEGGYDSPQLATVVCEECHGMILCSHCFKLQHSGGTLLHHSAISLDEMKSFPFSRCKIHRSREFELWCMECSKPVCFICERTEHKNHQTELIDEFFDSRKDVFSDKLEGMRQLYRHHTDTVKLVQNENDSLDTLVKDYTQQIREWFSVVREAATKREEKLISMLAAISNEIRDKWNKQGVNISSTSHFMREFIERGEAIIKAADQPTGSRLAFALHYTEMESLLERSTRNILAPTPKLRLENKNLSQIVSEIPKIGAIGVETESPVATESLSFGTEAMRSPVRRPMPIPTTIPAMKFSLSEGLIDTSSEDFPLNAIRSFVSGDMFQAFQSGQLMVNKASSLEALGRLLLRCVFSVQPNLFEKSTTWTFETLLATAATSRNSHPHMLKLLNKWAAEPTPLQQPSQQPQAQQQSSSAATVSTGYTVGDEVAAMCHFMLGLIHQKSVGVTKNIPEAVKHYKVASQFGNSLGQFYLGYCYLKGQGVPKSPSEAVRLFEASASKNNPMAASRLGSLHEAGIPSATGLVKDPTLAIGYYQASSAQGWAPGQDSLAQCYQHGKGVDRSCGVAFELYRAAAEQGFPEAQFHLGLLYESGVNGIVGRDANEARRWFAFAAAQNHQDAAAHSSFA